MKKVLAILLILVMVLGLFAACGNGETETPDPVAPAPPANGGDDNGDEEPEPATGEPLLIGAIASLSGALQDYGEQFQRGFILGLEYMTNGTNTVAGRPIEVIWEDTTTTPAVAAERTLVLLERNVEIVAGFTATGDALASLALFEEFETVVVIEPAAGDGIIQYPNWNEFVFRTGRTSGQDALAMLDVLSYRYPDGGATVGAIAPDTTFGYAMVEPFVEAAEARGFEVVSVEYIPPDATDHTAFILRTREAAPDYLYVIWAGANNPWNQLMELDMPGAGITIITGAPELEALYAMRPLGYIGGIGFCVYYYDLPQGEPMNEWLIQRHFEDFGVQPDIFVSGGMAAASAAITALELTGGVTDPAVLIPTMRGMEFNSPTGMRWFRAEDHQAMQVLFEVEFTAPEGVGHMVPRWVRTIPAETLIPPIMNQP